MKRVHESDAGCQQAAEAGIGEGVRAVAMNDVDLPLEDEPAKLQAAEVVDLVLDAGHRDVDAFGGELPADRAESPDTADADAEPPAVERAVGSRIRRTAAMSSSVMDPAAFRTREAHAKRESRKARER